VGGLPEQLARRLAERGVKVLDIVFPDLFGYARTVTVPARDADNAVEGGVGFDGSSVLGYLPVERSDMVVRARVDRLFVPPWSPKRAIALGEVLGAGGQPTELNPRQVLARVVEKVRQQGYEVRCGAELEFFILQPKERLGALVQNLEHGGSGAIEPLPHLTDVSYYFAPPPLDAGYNLKLALAEVLEQLGIRVTKMHHEVAWGQHEVTISGKDPLEEADNLFLTKVIISELARTNGLAASFMPKPVWGINGSGVHVHLSLWKEDRNAFYGGEAQLSELGQRFTAGILAHARELSAIVAPTVNSYKRLVHGYEAPVYVAWGYANRTALIRIPVERCPSRYRVEYRHPDPMMNPYLALATIIAAGMDGVEQRLEVPPPREDCLYHLSLEKAKEEGVPLLPAHLAEAVDLLDRSSLLRSILGEEVHRNFISNKRREWASYTKECGGWEQTKTKITGWELRHYLFLV